MLFIWVFITAFCNCLGYNCVEKSTGKRNISCLFFLCQTPYILFLTEIPVFIRFLQLYIVHHHEIKLKYIYTLQLIIRAKMIHLHVL